MAISYFFDQPLKSKQEAYEELIKLSRNDNYTTGNLLDFSYHQNYYKLIGIDLSRQTNMNIREQINFTRKVEEDDGVTMFFIAEKQQSNPRTYKIKDLNGVKIIGNFYEKELLRSIL